MTENFRELTAALYRVVSAAPAERNWDAVRPFYHPEARLVRTGIEPDGTPFVRVFTLDAYIANVRQLLDDNTRFSEVEVAQESVVFGNVARRQLLHAGSRSRAVAHHEYRLGQRAPRLVAAARSLRAARGVVDIARFQHGLRRAAPQASIA